MPRGEQTAIMLAVMTVMIVAGSAGNVANAVAAYVGSMVPPVLMQSHDDDEKQQWPDKPQIQRNWNVDDRNKSSELLKTKRDIQLKMVELQ